MEEYSKLTMKSLLLFAAGLVASLLFSSCGKDYNNPFKWNAANERTMEHAQLSS